MIKKKVALNDDIAKLAQKYENVSDSDLSEIVNRALKAYLINKLTPKQVKETLMTDDTAESAKYAEQFMQHSINDLNKF